MYTARIMNRVGEILTLTDRETEFQVESIRGLSPVPAQVNLTPMAGLDGAQFNSSKIQTRNIVVMLRIKGEVEKNRLLLYRFFRTKERHRFFFTNESRSVYTDGYVETCEVDLFEFGQRLQISIICPNPFFQSDDEQSTDITNVVPLFEFPFAINYGAPVPISNSIGSGASVVTNTSEVETGALFVIRFHESIAAVRIENTLTAESMVLRYPFRDGDKVTVDTHRGRKSVTLLRNGIERNLFSSIDVSSVFLQLDTGPNYFAYYADGEQYASGVDVTVVYTPEYRGV